MLTLAAAYGLLTVLAATTPDEVESRLAAVHATRNQYFVTQVDGLHPAPGLNLWYLEPDDPAAPPSPRAVSVYAYVDVPAGDDCARATGDTDLRDAPCTVERPGLAYVAGQDWHEYYYRRGPVLVRVLGTRAVDRGILRAATLSARPATDDELLTMLPPEPRHHRSFMALLKGFARSVVG
ncbi:hypothetical protein EV186_105222 [Labedaea rhizosphaerae]|uniref:Uncharacterized protein n=1 Tax=Labedaea rhizosphaerae TaxID=598644 RepID=A0A4R6S5I5_LABRH|nr:hypothetical protein EV186_105222 [Labedaea rhizosphaerae]